MGLKKMGTMFVFGHGKNGFEMKKSCDYDEKGNPVFERFYVCQCPVSWDDFESLSRAYPVNKHGHRTLEGAVMKLKREAKPKDGSGYFELKILKSYDKGHTFEFLSDDEYHYSEKLMTKSYELT